MNVKGSNARMRIHRTGSVDLTFMPTGGVGVSGVGIGAGTAAAFPTSQSSVDAAVAAARAAANAAADRVQHEYASRMTSAASAASTTPLPVFSSQRVGEDGASSSSSSEAAAAAAAAAAEDVSGDVLAEAGLYALPSSSEFTFADSVLRRAHEDSERLVGSVRSSAIPLTVRDLSHLDGGVEQKTGPTLSSDKTRAVAQEVGGTELNGRIFCSHARLKTHAHPLPLNPPAAQSALFSEVSTLKLKLRRRMAEVEELTDTLRLSQENHEAGTVELENENESLREKVKQVHTKRTLELRSQQRYVTHSLLFTLAHYHSRSLTITHDHPLIHAQPSSIPETGKCKR